MAESEMADLTHNGMLIIRQAHSEDSSNVSAGVYVFFLALLHCCASI